MVSRRARALAVLSTVYAAALVAVCAQMALSASRGWERARASAYSPADSGGRLACTGRRLTWTSRVAAHRTLPCGARIRICLRRGVCTTATIADRGPFVGGRSLDLAPGTYTALGFSSARAFGVRAVWVRRLR